jgi:TATA-binding protein-associated factor Taf7
MKYMARGWESKSVEEEQNTLNDQAPTADATEEKERQERVRRENARKVQALKLNLARIREQMERSSNPKYTEMLSAELKALESELAKLG